MAQTEASKKKQRAGQILSSMLRDIAEEKTELGGTVDDPKMISKGEALARLIWKRGLGWTEQKSTTDGLVDIEHQPDRVYVAILLDRLEGRVAAVEAGGKEKRKVSDKMGEQSKKRINSISKDATE